MQTRFLRWAGLACSLALMFLLVMSLQAQDIEPLPTPPPTPPPIIISPPELPSPQDFALGAQLPVVRLSYEVNNTTKTLQLAFETYPDHVDYEYLGVFPNQSLQVILRFPAEYAGQVVFAGLEEEAAGKGIIMASTTVGAVPTGEISSGDIVQPPPIGGSGDSQQSSGLTPSATSAIAVAIPTNGIVSIGFQAPQMPGRYHMRFGIGPLKPRLPFLVLNSDQAAQPQLLHCPVAN